MADPLTHSHDTSTPAMSAETVPSEEFVLVPREPTPEMLGAAWGANVWRQMMDGQEAALVRLYQAMTAAAPTLSASHLAKEGGDAGTVDDFGESGWSAGWNAGYRDGDNEDLAKNGRACL